MKQFESNWIGLYSLINDVWLSWMCLYFGMIGHFVIIDLLERNNQLRVRNFRLLTLLLLFVIVIVIVCFFIIIIVMVVVVVCLPSPPTLSSPRISIQFGLSSNWKVDLVWR